MDVAEGGHEAGLLERRMDPRPFVHDGPAEGFERSLLGVPHATPDEDLAGLQVEVAARAMTLLGGQRCAPGPVGPIHGKLAPMFVL